MNTSFFKWAPEQEWAHDYCDGHFYTWRGEVGPHDSHVEICIDDRKLWIECGPVQAACEVPGDRDYCPIIEALIKALMCFDDELSKRADQVGNKQGA